MKKLLKEYKWSAILSSLVILLPSVFGLAIWNRLPERMSTHWGANGEADGSSLKAFAVFGIPLILLALQWLCLFVSTLDKKNKDQSKKVMGMIFWLLPLLTAVMMGTVYSAALGMKFDIRFAVFPLMGLLFVVIGNYMPKTRQSFTFGVKVRWALANEENWNKTHRFAGKLWVAVGLLFAVCGFLPMRIFPWAMLGVILLAAIPPILYSYFYYQKQVREGRAEKNPGAQYGNFGKWGIAITLGIIALLAAILLPIMTTGNVETTLGETALTVNASYSGPLTVEYGAIDAVEYRENFDAGMKTFGFNSARLLVGQFQNDELGDYTIYAYTKSAGYVLLRSGAKTLVIGCRTAEEATALYGGLLAKTAG